MPHKCNETNCDANVFGGLKCRYHQFKRHMKGGDLYKPKTRQKNKIPQESKKRKEENKTYKQVKDELRQELIARGEWNCFFCMGPMGTEKGFHHTHKRDGTYFTDRKYLKPAHNNCHVDNYHQARIEDLLKRSWYQGFLSRLRELDESLWRIELRKQDKKANLFSEDLEYSN